MASKKSPKSKGPLLKVGNKVLIRTAVYHAVGVVVALFKVEGVAFVQLGEASFVGDTGLYSQATDKPLKDVPQAELEAVGGDGFLDIQIGSIGDVAVAF